MNKKIKLSVIIMLLCLLSFSFTAAAASKKVELTKYTYDSTVNRVAKAVGGMKIKSSKKYKSYCYKKNLKIGILADAGDSYSQITDIINTGNKQVRFCGIRIGDSYAKVKKTLKKNYYISVDKKYKFWWGDAACLTTKFKNGKLVSYTWKLRYTG